MDDGFYSNKKDGWVCGPCRESDEPVGTVLVYRPLEKQVEKYEIYEYKDDDFGFNDVEDPEDLDKAARNIEICDCQESPIDFTYVRTDAWRGYYDAQAEGWKVIHSDCILAMSEDEQQLKEFDTDIKQLLWKLGYEFAVAIGRTSNLFSSGYDVLIKTEQEQDIIKQMTLYTTLFKLNQKYRDPERFRLTALTGKSGGFEEKDKLLGEASRRLEKGENFDVVAKEILAKAQGGN